MPLIRGAGRLLLEIVHCSSVGNSPTLCSEVPKTFPWLLHSSTDFCLVAFSFISAETTSSLEQAYFSLL